MKRIGLLSDTHGFLDEKIINHLKECDEIWHAGDIGSIDVIDQLSEITTVKAVYGNIDGHTIRISCPENQIFECEGLKVWMTHIGGYPPKYNRSIIEGLDRIKPGLFICGHSHILKVMPDQKRNLLHINPGACGKNGFHKVRTMVRFNIDKGRIGDLQVIELMPRR